MLKQYLACVMNHGAYVKVFGIHLFTSQLSDIYLHSEGKHRNLRQRDAKSSTYDVHFYHFKPLLNT